MTYRAFEIPAGDEWMAFMGVSPHRLDDVETVTLVSGGETMEVSFSELGRSVRYVWSTGSRILSDVYRAGAVRMALQTGRARLPSTADLN
jgi:hypothetical protein